MTDELVTVLSSYRITLPKRLRKRYGIKVGDHMKVIEEEGKFHLVPVDIITRERSPNK